MHEFCIVDGVMSEFLSLLIALAAYTVSSYYGTGIVFLPY